MTDAVPAVVGSIMVVGVLPCCALFHSVCNFKGAQMNMQCSLIHELMLDKFKVGHNAKEATKTICCEKDESTVDHCIVTRWLKKVHPVCKNLDDQPRSGRPKTVGTEAVLHAKEANLESIR